MSELEASAISSDKQKGIQYILILKDIVLINKII